eukprot:9459647-Pyramimonas_sp.AAC.1
MCRPRRERFKRRVQAVVYLSRLAKSIHKLPPLTSPDSCALVHYDNDVNPGYHYDEAQGTALNIQDITG